MHRVDTTTAVAALPANEAPGTPGYFSKGDPGVGQPATIPGKDWFNAVQEELAHVITQAGLSLDKALHTQLLTALVLHITTRVAGFVTYPTAPEFISATQFRVPGDQTSKFHVYRRVKVSDLTTFGETITASSYDGVTDKTTVTVTNNVSSITAALVAVALGIGDPNRPLHAKDVQTTEGASVDDWFATSLHAVSGYQKLPGGLILQWAVGPLKQDVTNGEPDEVITFPIAFPNELFLVNPFVIDDPGDGVSLVVRWVKSSSTLSQAVIDTQDVTGNSQANWRIGLLAIGK